MPDSLNLPALLVADDEPELAALLNRASPVERAAFARALGAAYQTGANDAEARTGRFVATVLSPMLGLPDQEPHERPVRQGGQTLRSALRLLRGLARQ